MRSEQLPEIEQRYRTEPDRKARGIMGASLGGLISVYAALSRRAFVLTQSAARSSALMIEAERLASMVQRTGAQAFGFTLT